MTKVMSHITLTVSLALQREDAAEAASAGQQSQADTSASAPTSPLDTDAKADSGSKHKKILRSYGQKRVKPDSSAEDASTTLSADFLALVGGRR